MQTFTFSLDVPDTALKLISQQVDATNAATLAAALAENPKTDPATVPTLTVESYLQARFESVISHYAQQFAHAIAHETEGRTAAAILTGDTSTSDAVLAAVKLRIDESGKAVDAVDVADSGPVLEGGPVKVEKRRR